MYEERLAQINKRREALNEEARAIEQEFHRVNY